MCFNLVNCIYLLEILANKSSTYLPFVHSQFLEHIIFIEHDVIRQNRIFSVQSPTFDVATEVAFVVEKRLDLVLAWRSKQFYST